MENVKEWTLKEVYPSQAASDFILKDDLFAKYHAEYPDVPHEFFMSHFGRLMGNLHPFNSVVPLQKKGGNRLVSSAAIVKKLIKSWLPITTKGKIVKKMRKMWKNRQQKENLSHKTQNYKKWLSLCNTCGALNSW